MKNNGIKFLEKTLRENEGADVMVYISHALYGDQKIKTQLDSIFDEKRVGIRVGGQEIYVSMGDIKRYGIEDGIYFADSVMEIKIKLNRAV